MKKKVDLENVLKNSYVSFKEIRGFKAIYYVELSNMIYTFEVPLLSWKRPKNLSRTIKATELIKYVNKSIKPKDER